ncbi:atypical MEK-related kinase (incomplete catalytic triad) [Toxoplasma gondii VAND]|uniref:Atypical MEK-related kinase (Incomplete catalytic triad) n=2 Tax=Toxoplasma gondii TaxID=5811 RepID=A0A086QDY7_TOXGO|nr:atypical MEK-related kinase (incomplete catalytic triad) [Toxoplasma gondii VAND]
MSCFVAAVACRPFAGGATTLLHVSPAGTRVERWQLCLPSESGGEQKARRHDACSKWFADERGRDDEIGEEPPRERTGKQDSRAATRRVSQETERQSLRCSRSREKMEPERVKRAKTKGDFQTQTASPAASGENESVDGGRDTCTDAPEDDRQRMGPADDLVARDCSSPPPRKGTEEYIANCGVPACQEGQGAPRLPGLFSCVVKTYHKLDEEIFVPFSSWPIKRRDVIQRLLEIHRCARHPHVAQLLAVGLWRSRDSASSSKVDSNFLPPSERLHAPLTRTISSDASPVSSSSLSDWPLASIALAFEDGGVPLAQKVRDLPSTSPRGLKGPDDSVGISSDENGEKGRMQMCASSASFSPPAGDDVSMVYCVPVRGVRTAGDSEAASLNAGCETPPEGTTYVLLEETGREVLKQLVSALMSLHARNIFHLDVKPSNVVVAPPFSASLVRRVYLHSTADSAPKKRQMRGQPRRHPKKSKGGELHAYAELMLDDLDGEGEDGADIGGRGTAEAERSPEETERASELEEQGSDIQRRAGHFRCLLVDFDSAQRGVNGTTCVYPGGTSRAFIPPEEFSAVPSVLPADPAPMPWLPTKDFDQTEMERKRVCSQKDSSGISALDGPLSLLDGEKKDVWALGCLLAILLTGRHPFLRPAGRHGIWNPASEQFLAFCSAHERSEAEVQTGNACEEKLNPGEELQTNAATSPDEPSGLSRPAGREDKEQGDPNVPVCQSRSSGEVEGNVYFSDMEYCLALVSGAQPQMDFRGLPQLSPEAKDLLRGMLASNPAQRLSLEAVRGHPWLTGNSLRFRRCFDTSEAS